MEITSLRDAGVSSPAGKVQALELCIICPGACPAAVQLRTPYLSPGSSSVGSGSSIPVPPPAPGADGVHQRQCPGGGRAPLGHPEPTLHLPVEHPMVPTPRAGGGGAPPPPIFMALLSLQGDPRPTQRCGHGGGIGAQPLLMGEAASVGQAEPVLADHRGGGGGGRRHAGRPRAAAAPPGRRLPRRSGGPRGARGMGVPTCWVISRVFLCVSPPSPQEAPPAR